MKSNSERGKKERKKIKESNMFIFHRKYKRIFVKRKFLMTFFIQVVIHGELKKTKKKTEQSQSHLVECTSPMVEEQDPDLSVVLLYTHTYISSVLV